MIPTLLGNIVGGGLFVATPYWYLYLTGDDGVSVDFNIGSLASAMEAGGPMRKTTSGTQPVGHFVSDHSNPYNSRKLTPICAG